MRWAGTAELGAVSGADRQSGGGVDLQLVLAGGWIEGSGVRGEAGQPECDAAVPGAQVQ